MRRLLGELDRQRLAQVLRQALHLGRLTGHQGVRLDIEREVRRRPFDPELGRAASRQRVVRGIDLDDREPARVVAEALLRGVGVRRVEDAAGRHRGIRPGRRPEADGPATGRLDRHGRDVFGHGREALGGTIRARIVGRVEIGCRRTGELAGGLSGGHGRRVPPFWEAMARAASASGLPSVSSEFVHRHRLARATAALASHGESELGRHSARCLVLSLVDVRSDAVGFGPTPEVADGGVHRLGRDPVIAPLLGYPPARLDLVRLDPIDAISSQAQLRASEEPLLSQIPDRPGPEPALPPLHLSRADVAQRVSRPARRRCVLGFIEPRQRSQEQPFRPENDPAVDGAPPGRASPFHARSMSPRSTALRRGYRS